MNPQETAELTPIDPSHSKKEFQYYDHADHNDMSLVMEVTERIYVLNMVA